MTLAVRFRYYKAVTPSMDIVELTTEQWREFFLLNDAEKRRLWMMKFLGRESSEIKELWWIPVSDQERLLVLKEEK